MVRNITPNLQYKNQVWLLVFSLQNLARVKPAGYHMHEVSAKCMNEVHEWSA